MSITAILAYFCNIDFAGITANYGTALRVTIFQMYFRGEFFRSFNKKLVLSRNDSVLYSMQ